MSRYHSYLNTAVSIIRKYHGKEPLASFLKFFFAENKKYGSRDRKQIADLCYCYFRMGKMGTQVPIEERILAAVFLCSNEGNELLKHLKPEWNEKITLSFEGKCLILNQDYDRAEYSLNDLFPFEKKLSGGIVINEFSKSFLLQPDLFLRIRPGHKNDVLQKLQNSNLSFQFVKEDCIALPNSTKIESILSVNKEVVIQDYSSQGIKEYFPNYKRHTIDHKPSIWDCCAASGGKSILAKDVIGEVELTVSDIRESILSNLKKRFAEAGIKKYKSFVADLTHGLPFKTSGFDLIIADVPCSGSGTWERTPEQLYYFQSSEIEKYSSLQKKIAANVIKALRPGGHFLYITCSVFKKENEEVVDFVRQQFSMVIIRQEVLKGYDKRADTMFAALLQKKL